MAVVIFVLDGWLMALCLWLAVRLVEGEPAGNPPLLALAISYGLATATLLLDAHGLLTGGALFFLLMLAYRMPLPAAFLTSVVLGTIELGLFLGLAALAATAGLWGVLGGAVILVALSARWWRHDLGLFGAWLGRSARAGIEAPRAAPRQEPRVPRAWARPKRERPVAEPAPPPSSPPPPTSPPPSTSPPPAPAAPTSSDGPRFLK